MILQSHPEPVTEREAPPQEPLRLSGHAMMSVLAGFHAEIQECHETQEVLELAAQALVKLGVFQSFVFLLNEPPDWDFELRLSQPPERRGALQRRVNDAIKAGTFAWALRQARFVPVPGMRHAHEAPTLLHRLGTRARTLGMFAAVCGPGVDLARQAQAGWVAVILSSVACAIENLRLRAEVENHNTELQERVRQRTFELTEANQLLGREIAGHARAEEALAQEKDRLAVTLRCLGDGVITTDSAGRVLLLNPVAEQLVGWPQADAAGCLLADVFKPVKTARREPHAGFLEAALTRGEETDVPHHSVLPARDGRERVIGFKVSPIRRGAGAAIVGAVLVVRDMTEHERMTAAARKHQQVESLGVLAAGIAHDFNNILTVVMGNVSLAAEKLGPRTAVHAHLDEAAGAAVQARELTGQLLTFARGGTPLKTAARLPEIIRESTRFGLHGSPVRPAFALPPNLWAVEVDSGQLNQVIHNLVINAVQAMPGGGCLRVAAGNRAATGGESHGLPAGRYVELSVADQGCGVSAEDLPRIFDPYFTTKKSGNGLGLAMCAVIIRDHGGRITVESELGKGTTFRIFLPATDKTPVTASAPERGTLTRRRGRILVLEDDEALQKLLAMMIQRLGYRADLVSRGEDAVRVFQAAEQEGEPIDGAVLDLTVPGGMGGCEVIQRLRALRPGFPALVSSGAANNPAIAEFQQHGFCGAIAKPYTLAQFAEALGRLLPAARA